jgi:hypothetical protein
MTRRPPTTPMAHVRRPLYLVFATERSTGDRLSPGDDPSMVSDPTREEARSLPGGAVGYPAPETTPTPTAKSRPFFVVPI